MYQEKTKGKNLNTTYHNYENGYQQVFVSNVCCITKYLLFPDNML